MDKQPKAHLAPWEPYRIMSSFVFLTIFGAGIWLGLNWKRLEKPEWQARTILLSIFFPLLMIGLAIGWVTISLPYKNMPEQLLMSVPMLALGANFGYLWALARLQSGAYKKFQGEGFSALLTYEYDVDGALFFGGIVTLIFAVVTVFIFPLLRRQILPIKHRPGGVALRPAKFFSGFYRICYWIICPSGAIRYHLLPTP